MDSKKIEKIVDFRSQQVESCSITAQIGFLSVTESVALPADQGSMMSHLQTLIRAAKIRGRVCPKCQAVMLLCDITPVGSFAEQHKFKCVDCNCVEMRMVDGRAIADVAA
jgi:hypothetical protein